MYISLDKIYYVHARARYILLGHVRVVRAGFSNILSAGGNTLTTTIPERRAMEASRDYYALSLSTALPIISKRSAGASAPNRFITIFNLDRQVTIPCWIM